jgi:hypothetical protein
MQSPGRAGSCSEVGCATPVVSCRDRARSERQLQDGDPGASRALNPEAATMSSGNRRHHLKAVAMANVAPGIAEDSKRGVGNRDPHPARGDRHLNPDPQASVLDGVGDQVVEGLRDPTGIG